MTDFDFYDDESEEEVVKDIKGVTDSVSKFIYTDMEFPCICLKPDIILPKHKWKIISKLAKPDADKNISLYIIRQGDIFKIGSLSGIQIKAFIDIIGLENMTGFHSKDKELIGDKLYVLSS